MFVFVVFLLLVVGDGWWLVVGVVVCLFGWVGFLGFFLCVVVVVVVIFPEDQSGHLFWLFAYIQNI